MCKEWEGTEGKGLWNRVLELSEENWIVSHEFNPLILKFF
jgi:hypothetical protein